MQNQRAEMDDSEIGVLLSWWQQQHMQQLKQEADLIRNNLLQEVLAIRRSLELSCEITAQGQTSSCDRGLVQLEQIYAALEQLSDRLDSPYLRDSLPLALRHTAESWDKVFSLRTNLPQSWEAEPFIHTQLLLTFVNTLCAALATAKRLPRDCGITLKRQANINEFTFYAIYGDLPPPVITVHISTALLPILKTFQLLVPGHYVADAQRREMTWILRWSA